MIFLPQPFSFERSALRLSFLTEGDSIGPLDVLGHQNLSVDSVQSRLFNFGPISPVGPVHEPVRNATASEIVTVSLENSIKWNFL